MMTLTARPMMLRIINRVDIEIWTFSGESKSVLVTRAEGQISTKKKRINPIIHKAFEHVPWYEERKQSIPGNYWKWIQRSEGQESDTRRVYAE